MEILFPYEKKREQQDKLIEEQDRLRDKDGIFAGKEREDIVTSSLKDMIESFRKEVKKYFKI